MPTEIERKFLVKDDSYKAEVAGEFIRQGFLSTDKERVVRVRIKGEKAWITVKGLSVGTARSEFEYPIPLEDAAYLLDHICYQPTIEKYRYVVPFEGFTWEVDEFLGDNKGLVIAEIELLREDQTFTKPRWVGKEVTSAKRYYNSNLVKNPFNTW